MYNKALEEYLRNRAEQLSLSPDEKNKIDTSVNFIRDKLRSTFSADGIKEVWTFGSFDRGTLLSRKIDDEADVDLLIVFDEKKWEAQTYLNKLKKFAEDNYKRSEIFQDHPTIVVQFDHIKFELTPCVFEDGLFSDDYIIPKKRQSEVRWISTDPVYLKDKIAKYSAIKKKLIDLIVLIKFWNLVNQSLYDSYVVEKFVLDHFDPEENLCVNFFNAIYQMSTIFNSEEQNAVNRKAKKFRSNIELLLENGMSEYALLELKKLLPEISM